MYVQRNRKGDIIAAYTLQQFLGQEELPNGSPPLMKYLTRDPIAHAIFSTVGISIDDLASVVTRVGLFVERAGDSAEIVSAESTPSRDFQERVPLDAPELIAFLKREPDEPAPPGFRYQSTATGWRVLSLCDGLLLAKDLPSREACVTFMRERAAGLKQNADKFRAKWEAR